MTRACRHHGFTIVEMLMGIIIVALIMTIGAELFQTAIRAGHGAAESHDAASGFDAAVADLRADVWGANVIDVAAGGAGVTLKQTGGGETAWSISGQTLTRSKNRMPPRSWNVPAEMSFAGDGAELLLEIRGGKNSPAGEVRLVSQVRLLEKVGR